MTKNNCEIIRLENKDHIIKRYTPKARGRFVTERNFYLIHGERFQHFLPKLYRYDDNTLELFLEKKGMSLSEFNYRKNRKNLHKFNSQILEMVDELKSHGIYHNDIRYKNVLIDCKDNLSLIDFEMWGVTDEDKNDDNILPVVPHDKFKYTIFVINAYPERTLKYLNDDRYTIWSAKTPEDISDEIVSKYHFRCNAKELLKKKICACSESHLSCIRHIRDHQINNAIIIEDDALINFDRISELEDIDEITYVGGMYHPLALKNIKDFNRPDSIMGINNIDPKEFLITNAHGYYIPNFNLCDILLKQKNPLKRRAIDVEFKNLQKQNEIKQFIFPAISTLVMADAKTGFTWSQYKLKDDLTFY